MVNSARLPVGTIALRLGWAQGQTPTDTIFTRAGNHPIDGAAVGTVAGLAVPVFPPALNTDPSLYLFIWIGTAQVNIADIRLSGGGGTLIGSISNGAAYNLEGVAGTVYVSNQRLSPGLSAFQISAVVGGDLIASQPWVTEQIAAIPASGGGGAWYWMASVTGGLWTAGTARAAVSRSFPIGQYADYAAIRTAIQSGAIPQIAVRISQNDVGDADDDHGTTVHPNISGFYQLSGSWRVFPGHALNVDPVGFTVAFAPAGVTVTSDAGIPATNTVVVRVAVWD